MKFFQYFAKERNRLVLDTISTAIAVLLALSVDSVVDFYREKNTFHSMLHAIKVEAEANQYILENSFKPNYDKIVYRPFTLKTFEQYWQNIIIVEHATPEQMKVLSAYYLSLIRANGMREAGQAYAYDEKLEAKYGDNLRVVWKNNLVQCEQDIKGVLELVI